MINVIAIDGPSASGKGAVAKIVAETLVFAVLDSGVLYRTVGLMCVRAGIDTSNSTAVEELLKREIKDVSVVEGKIFLKGKSVEADIRTLLIGKAASTVAKNPNVREIIVDLQRSFIKEPGLVADGRDMTSVIFPDAKLKIFLTASAKIRAERRFAQYVSRGDSGLSFEEILADLERRDKEDSTRVVSPLIQVPDAHLINSDHINQLEVAAKIVELWKQL